MHRSVLVVLLAVAMSYGSVQVQMPDVAELQQPDDDLQTQLRDLQRNVSDLWTYIYELRTAVTHHLTHLRQHQIELESAVHRMEHSRGQSEPHTHSDQHGGDHHHSGEHHSHSGEHGEHSHSGEHHSHGNEQHSHSGEQHSHSGEHGHSHSGEHGHSHSGEHGHSHSGELGHYSHSHSHSHSDEHGHSHHEDPKDSHENEDTQQQTQQVDDPVSEPIVVPEQRREHHHHHHHRTQVSPTSTSRDPLQLMNENHHHHHHGHHHHEPLVRSRNRTVLLPKYSEYSLYDFAVCDVQPNRAIPEEKQQEVVGQVTFWQKKMGGPLNLHIRLRGFKIGDHASHHGGQREMQEENNETPAPQGGHRHGFHIHALSDLSNGCQSTGPHYNPKSVNHGGPNALVRHVGDLGNIECDDHGVTNVIFSDDVASLKGQYSIIGKALVIHADTDDLGLGGDEESLKTGNAGTRIACCVIERVEKIPIKSYKAMKTASQYQNR